MACGQAAAGVAPDLPGTVPEAADGSDTSSSRRVPIYAVVASTRQRLLKIGACIDYRVEWTGGGAPPPVPAPR